ncbi:MAG: crossover junction endodeoxyribonuclease RuvC [Thermoleophilia bacterium]|nr:crossover junction endodeoxyribonuclease RuvC [Thermoleophilia bacterium]
MDTLTKTAQLILGLDPGTAVTGWGVIEYRGDKSRLVAHGTIATSAKDPAHERLQQIYLGVLDVIDQYRPEVAAIEELFGGVNIKTALAVGQARGVIVLACAERGVTPSDYTPLRIKQAVVGYGRASKLQVQQMVKVLLALPKVPTPDHAADALGVAICHAHSQSVSNFLKAGTQETPMISSSSKSKRGIRP